MGILRTDRVSGLGGANAIKGSVNFTGSRYAESYFDIDASTDFAFGTGDFTIECWVNFTHDDADSYYKRVYMTDGPTGNASGNFQIAIVPSTGVVNLWEDGSALDVSGSTKVTKVGWVHIAAVRSGSGSNNLKLYVNGAQDLQTTYTTSISPNSGNPRPRIGAYAEDQGGSLPGHVSNLRVSNEALYTSAFTVPTTELTKLSSTILLCFQSPSNILKEETDKILIPRRNNTNGAFPSASRFTPNSPVGFSTTTDVGTQFGSTFDGVTTFDSQAYMVPPGGNTRERNRGRGLIMGGAVSPGSTNTTQIKYFDIASGGITEDFGQTTVARRATGSLSSSTRGLMGGGFVTTATSPHTVSNVIDFVTIANTANATDFGDMQQTGYSYATASNQTRGLFAGGYRPNNSAVVNTIDLITIATTGNASNFGDLTRQARSFSGAESTTRGVFFGGAPSTQDTIDFVTFSTTGDATDFGNLTVGRDYVFGSSSSTRAVMGGGRDPNTTNIIDFITIASAGNATDFGDLTSTSYYFNAATGNSTRAVWVGTSTIVNSMEFVTIATLGNASDFGDQNGTAQHSNGAASDSHGGIE